LPFSCFPVHNPGVWEAEADSKELLLIHQGFLSMIAVCNMVGIFPA